VKTHLRRPYYRYRRAKWRPLPLQQHRRLEVPGTNGIDPNALSPMVEGHCPCKLNYGAFGRAICCFAFAPHHTEIRSDIDDTAVANSDHVAERCAGAAHHCRHVDVHDAQPLCICSFKKRPAGRHTSVVYEDVETAVFGYGTPDEQIRKGRIGDVAPGYFAFPDPIFRPFRDWAIERISGNSMVPSTAEWLAKICSISVEPARGNPTMKIGSGASAPNSALATICCSAAADLFCRCNASAYCVARESDLRTAPQLPRATAGPSFVVVAR
jgi:hypothetical protein